MATIDPDNFQLTDFMDLPTLQEIQDSFAAVANVKVRITDADGNRLTQPTPTREFLRRQRAIAQAAGAEEEDTGPQKSGREYVAPITVNNQRLGTIRMTPSRGAATEIDEARLDALASKLGLDAKIIRTAQKELSKCRDNRPAAIQFLFLLANAIARLCFQEYQLRQRIDELTAVYTVATMLADARDLPNVLNRTVELVCEVMRVKASSIRLIDQESDELVIRAVHNLSREYLDKGPILLSRAEIDRTALAEGHSYVRDMAGDPRVQYPDESKREGIASMLSVGMTYKSRAIGVLRVYTAEEKHFSHLEIELLRAIASQAAAAIENARLLQESLARAEVAKQVALAAQVQQRMVPQKPPTIPGIDLAFEYVPCYGLGGDLYDFLELPQENLGLIVADVSGKGVPASLIMASVRAAIRAHIDNVYYLYEVVRRVNVMVCRDNRPGEFVSLFYGVFDTHSRRLTYCNAGHPPPLLLRDGKVSELKSNSMVLGIDPAETYVQSVVELRPGDRLLLYTDGVFDAMNFAGQTWGMARLRESFARDGANAEEIAQNILWDMRKHTGLTERNDDVTMMVLRVL